MEEEKLRWLYYILLTLREKRDLIYDDVCFHDVLINLYKKRLLKLKI